MCAVLVLLASAGAGIASHEPLAFSRHDAAHLHDWHSEADAHTENAGSVEDTGEPFDEDPIAHGTVLAVASRRPSGTQRHQFSLVVTLEPEKYNPGVTPLP